MYLETPIKFTEHGFFRQNKSSYLANLSDFLLSSVSSDNGTQPEVMYGTFYCSNSEIASSKA